MNDKFSKEEAKQILENMITDDNELVVNNLMVLLNKMSVDNWNELVTKNGINSENINEFLADKILAEKTRFNPLNDLISYGISGNTIHIHVIPKDAKEFFNHDGLSKANLDIIDALDKIKTMLKNDEIKNINNIFAVSPILKIRKLQEMFRNLNFAVSETTNKYFLDKFPAAKSVYQAILTRDMIFTEEWEQNKEKIYEQLKGETSIEKTEDNDFINKLKSSVNVDSVVSGNKEKGEVESDCLEM